MSEQKFTRRDFLQSACIGVSALAVSGSGASVLADEAKDNGNKKGLPSCDILVIGSGGAGLRAAVAARKANPNLTVVVATKMMPSRNATCMAEGGINGVTDFSNGDSYKLHAYDTIKGGAYLVDQDAALKFTEMAGKVIAELDYTGTLFSRSKDGGVAQRMMGGASKRRCNFSADKTGHILMHSCLDDAISNGVKFLMDHELLEISVENGKSEGAVLRNIQTGEIYPVLCKSLVIATGGYTRIFYNRTSTPYIATGDGVAAALRAGLGFEDPEMIQFHPTGVANGGTLITEAARGEGGYLLNNKGERFMKNYHEKMELAPRDVVARAIEIEIREGRGYGEGLGSYVLCDVRHLGKEKILKALPKIRHTGLLFENIDLVEQPVPIRPTAHYSMGGIEVVKIDDMSTKIPGIYVGGEASCISIHGANRLGGNSLTDAMVTGYLAGVGATNYAKDAKFGNGENASKLAKQWQDKFKDVTSGGTTEEMYKLREELGRQNWDNMGIFRTQDKLDLLAKNLEEIQAKYDQLKVPNSNPIMNTAFTDYVELGNLILLSRCACLAAQNRLESRGAHTREDYPKRDDVKFLKHSIVTLKDNKLELGYKDVVITEFSLDGRKPA
ncbi:succinate dehydrogenase [Campylobacter mucosalis]|uniref:8-methylmenaquinol:fumarate reductase flavoprotein subunit n=1 Tax=Campylobacter mucosalis TaxID=202 RepID=UPI0004D4E550|nr:8-methylmenaquinol:fumarate reductase flavoprotein subunit [Campylobacter mucosalis]KEA46520.1 succinate dehydrogenase [Campylobacter mucosalis]QKF62982.1 methylmenaquinol:fumarate reductase, MfrA subunit [Campylobacter mucosalis]